jgi:hypothetical protein
MRRQTIELLIDGVVSGEPAFLLVGAVVFAGVLIWGLQVGRRRRREKAERENDWPR